MKRLDYGILAVILGLALAPAFAQQPETAAAAPIKLDIAAQSLAEALREFAHQSGLQLIFEAEDVNPQLRSPRLAGLYPPEAALTQLLENSGLKYKYVNAYTVAIREREDAKTRTTTYVEAAAADSEVRLAQAEIASRSGQEEQQQTAASVGDNKQESAQLDEIVVTGTHIRGAAPASSPVIVMSRQDIERSGYATSDQLLRSLPQNFSAGASEEVFNTIRNGAETNFTAGASVNLRGLGTDSTLVLVDGQRLAPSGFGDFVDVSLIPLAAIERLEVLTDGASAIYGSDAVGGVVNYILRRDYDGAETRVRYGGVSSGGLDELRASQTLGNTWSTGNLLFAYEYYRRDPLDANSRSATEEAPDPFDALPKAKRHSAFLNGAQTVADGVDISGTAYYSTRDFERRYFESFTSAPARNFGETTQYGANLRGAFDLTDRWHGEVSGGYSAQDASGDNVDIPTGESLALNHNEAKTWSFDAKADGALAALPGGNLALALGSQYRDEQLDINFLSSRLERNVLAFFSELRIPLVGSSNRRSGIERLELSAALRYEDYSDFGSSADPKFGVAWSPIAGLNLRGTYGTSFRAPQLFELNESNLTPFLLDLPNGSGSSLAFVLLGNNAALIPEESTNWTAGIDFTPPSLPRLNASLTYFKIRFEERILALPFDFSVLSNPEQSVIVEANPDAATLAALAANPNFANFTDPQADPLDAAFIVDNRLRNLSVTRLSGLDLGLKYTTDVGNGELAAALNGSYLFEFENQLTATSRSEDVVDTVFNPPNLRLRSGLSFDTGAFGTSLSVNYVNGYRDDRFTPSRDVDAYTTVDLHLSYGFENHGRDALDGLTLSLSVLNAFDEAAPFVEDTGTDGIDFDPENADILGRLIAVEIGKRW